MSLLLREDFIISIHPFATYSIIVKIIFVLICELLNMQNALYIYGSHISILYIHTDINIKCICNSMLKINILFLVCLHVGPEFLAAFTIKFSLFIWSNTMLFLYTMPLGFGFSQWLAFLWLDFEFLSPSLLFDSYLLPSLPLFPYYLPLLLPLLCPLSKDFLIFFPSLLYMREGKKTMHLTNLNPKSFPLDFFDRKFFYPVFPPKRLNFLKPRQKPINNH